MPEIATDAPQINATRTLVNTDSFPVGKETLTVPIDTLEGPLAANIQVANTTVRMLLDTGKYASWILSTTCFDKVSVCSPCSYSSLGN